MLESLDLSWNRLEGTIPRELVNLDSLGFLNFSKNHLVGPIPRGRHFDTFGDDSYKGNLDLCGFPLAKDCGDTEAPPPATPWEAEQQYDDSEFFDGFTWKAILLGYGCGLALGLVMGEDHLVGPFPRRRHLDAFGNDLCGGNLALGGLPMTKDCGDTWAKPPQSPLGFFINNIIL
ncbi:receptor-like protein 9DC3 [Coffea eugenioides]|uniref:receptor-like protein 9DC3 n=1 Tax=Coffea eugenioides TaxID=49369 RepID=UPI000F60B336|nr:receptor-like protein 9DC3 [Coffea eugenioides]